MKRMTENAISYYTVTPNDIKNMVAQGGGMFSYTPSPEFIEVLHDFKSVLRVDWMQVSADISRKIGAKLSVLYPVNIVSIADGNVSYAYSAGSSNNKQINPSFFELEGQYFILWESISN